MGRKSLSVNLSYVLHEPSTSHQVRDIAQRIKTRRRRAAQAVEQLRAMPRDQFRGRLIIHPESEVPEKVDQPLVVLSVEVGAPSLLGRAIESIWGAYDTDIWCLDGSGCRRHSTMPFFRGNAALCIPDMDTDAQTGDILWFTSLVFRPGYETLLFQANAIPLSAIKGSVEKDFHPGIPLAEAIVRTHVEQWGCTRQLWGRPAEEELPEFRGR